MVYIVPHVSKTKFDQCLNKINAAVTGQGVIMGDLNSRHTRWDKTCNPQGKWLVQWAQKNKWIISAPTEPTFAAHIGTSTVDLFLSKGVELKGTSVLHGPWDGCSDHFAVSAEIALSPTYRVSTSFIPHSQRANPRYVASATHLYHERLPQILELVNNSSTQEDLERVYEHFKATTLEPWAPARRQRPKRFKYFWNHHLEYLKRQRSKKYKAATKQGSETAWAEYRLLDRRIRSLVKNQKRKILQQQTRMLANADPRDSLKSIKSILRKSSPISDREICVDSGSLNPVDFTRFLATPMDKRHSPSLHPISVTPDFIAYVTRAIQKSKRNKASGVDELFSEAFTVAPQAFAKILCSFWAKCSELNGLLADWQTALMVPIHKKEDKSNPANYRPIALLSHARQMISSAIGSMIRTDYTFHPTQLGFRDHTGTETAIVRHAYNHHDGYRYTAVLDLKSAYDSVPRDILMRRVRRRLHPSTADMIALELQPMTIVTKGDASCSTAQISVGVPQGGKSSPPLYNVYMDSFAEHIDSADLDVKVSMFADDVKLQAKCPQDLQRALDVSTEWARAHKMTWNVKKCHILQPASGASPGDYQLSGQKMLISASTEYLGVNLHRGILSTQRNIQRVKAACQRIGMLKAAGISRKLVPSSTLVNICRTFVYPVADYAIHLMPVKQDGSCDLGRELELLDYKVAEYALGCIGKEPPVQRKRASRIAGRLPRHLKMAKLPDWLQRIRMRLRSLGRRLHSRARLKGSDELAKADALQFRCFRSENKSPSDLGRKDLYIAWQRLCRGRRRGTPIPEQGHVPILQEQDPRVRDAGIRWYTGAFPGISDDLQMALGPQKYRSAVMRLGAGLREKNWTKQVRLRTLESIELILHIRQGNEHSEGASSARGRKRHGEPVKRITRKKRRSSDC